MFRFSPFSRHHRCESPEREAQHRHGGHGRHSGCDTEQDATNGRSHGARGPKMFDSGSLRFVVLQFIAEQPRHGYEIIKAIEAKVGGGYTPSPGVIYPLLSLLEDQGYVVVTPDGNKKLHSITPEGVTFLDENRALVAAIFARFDQAGLHDSANGGSVGTVRNAMHVLKTVVITRARDENASAERLEQIRTILHRAAEEIQALN